METPSLILFILLVCALGANAVILAVFRARLRDQVLLSLIPVFNLLQTFWVLLRVIVSYNASVHLEGDVWVDFNAAAFRIGIGLVLMSLVAISVSFVLLLFKRHSLRSSSMAIQEEKPMRIMLYMFAFEPLFYYFGIYVMPRFSIRPVAILSSAVLVYLQLSLVMAPVLIGLNWHKHKGPMRIFWCVMVVSGFMAFAEGSRYMLFMPIVYFVIGFMLTISNKLRLIALVVAVVLAAPVFYISGIIATVRDGARGDYSGSIIGNAQTLWQLIEKAGSENSEGYDMKSVMLQGIDRMIVWSGLVAMSSTPDTVPFRGFHDFWDEVASYGNTTLLGNGSTQDLDRYDQDFGAGAAQRYGFAITQGGTVPFPILADGWSRGGLLVVVLYTGIMCLLLSMAESFARLLFSSKPNYLIGIITILASSAYEKMGYFALVYNIRYLLLLVVFWFVIFRFISVKKTISNI